MSNSSFHKIKSNTINFLSIVGGLSIAKLLTRKYPKVLMYHRFSKTNEYGKLNVDIFDLQLRELKDNFNVLSLSTVCEELKQGKTPLNTIVITIDDGYNDFYNYAYPLLKKYNLPATIFITSNFIDNKIWMWPDMISYMIDNTRLKNHTIEINNNIVNLFFNIESSEHSTWDRLINICLELLDHERIELIDRLSIELDVKIPQLPCNGYKPMSWKEIREMSCNGIDIGAHTDNPCKTDASYCTVIDYLETANCCQAFKIVFFINIITEAE